MISIVIPTFNEARYLPSTLDAIARNQGSHEVIVVDAGSVDATIAMALDYDARLVPSRLKQRASQMNVGAQSARGSILLFLHADTRLPENALSQIEVAMANRKFVGGGFARRYESPSWFLRGTCALAGIRTRFTGWFLGDQAIFVRSEVFKILEGFRELDLFEDLDFSRRLRRQGRVVTLSPSVVSSARRFSQCSPWRRTWSDLIMTWRYLRGVDPNQIAREYRSELEDSQRPPQVASADRRVSLL